MVDFRKLCPLLILAIFMQAPILKEAKDNNNNKKNKKTNQMVLKTTKVSVSLSCQF